MGGSGSKQDLFDLTFEMKHSAKSLDKQAVKIESSMKKEEAKVVSLMNSGNHEAARIAAEGIIRMKGEALNCRRMAARMGAVAQKLETAERTKNISESIKKSVPIIQKGLKQMEKIGISKAINDFDQVFEELDVKTDSMNTALDGVYSSTIDQGSVETYMKQLQDSQAIDMGSGLATASQKSLAGGAKVKEDEDDLMARLKNLQQ